MIGSDDLERTVEALEHHPRFASSVRRSATTAETRLADATRVRLSVAAPEEHAAVWIDRTGAASHLDALRQRALDLGLELRGDGPFSADGERIVVRDEAQLYDRLGLAFVLPELREGQGEIDEAHAERSSSSRNVTFAASSIATRPGPTASTGSRTGRARPRNAARLS